MTRSLIQSFHIISIILIFVNEAAATHLPAEDRCRKYEFRCSNTKCIPSTLRCNGADDCGDNSDESCDTVDLFTCSDSVQIQKSQLCDGNKDCSDDENPKICEKNKCASDEFMCKTKPMNCISRKKVCNSLDDCQDKSDESPEACEMASKSAIVECDSNSFRCASKLLCISRIYYCDGTPDCLDKSDEINCTKPDKPKEIIPDTTMNNVTNTTPICLPHEFYCGAESTSTCISLDWYCDGSYDCTGTNLDEENCPNFKCPPNKPNKCKSIDSCYETEKHCDGFDDCKDKSDELGCPKPDTEVKCHLEEFKCVKNNTCMPMRRVCDNENDCGDYSDERPGGSTENCRKNPCKSNNGNCDQICINLYHTHKCQCKPGYKIHPKNESKCVDIDECANKFTCSHKCINLEGSFQCECFEGFQKSHDNVQLCLAVGEKFLLFTAKNSIRELRLWRQYMEMLYSPSEKKSTFLPIGIDFDYKNKHIFWTQFEPTPGIIQNYHSVSKPEQKQHLSLVNDRIHSPVGLAFDWIHGLLFWTDIYYNEISVLNVTSGIRRVLVKFDNSSKVRSIVVHPKFRRIYWTDWGKEPKIECMGMDGNDRKVVVKEGLVTPNGLALDYIFNDLYWIDAKARNINAYNIKTGVQREVKSHINAYVFDIDVFEDWLYLSDWHNEKIIQIHKKTGQEKLLVSSPKPMGVKLFHQLAQPENIENVCQNNPCQYLCLPSSMNLENNIKFRCACPDYSHLLADEKSCFPVSPEYSSKINSKSTTSNYKSQKAPVNVYFVVGFVTTVFMIVLLLAVVFGIAMYRNYIRRVIKRATNFNNPTYYHKNSNIEIQLLNSYPVHSDVYDTYSSQLLPRNQSDDGLQMVATN